MTKVKLLVASHKPFDTNNLDSDYYPILVGANKNKNDKCFKYKDNENQNDINHAQQILDQTGHTSQEYRDARKIIKDLSIDVPGWIAYQNGGSMLKQISNDVIILSDKIKYDDQLGLDSKISN